MVVVKRQKKDGKEMSEQKMIDMFRKLSAPLIKEYRKRSRYIKPSQIKQEEAKRLKYRDMQQREENQ